MREIEVKPFKVQHDCETCGSVHVKHSGTYPMSPPLYEITCIDCGAVGRVRPMQGAIIYKEI